MYRWSLKTRHDSETLPMFDLEPSCSMTERSISTPSLSAEPLSLYGRQEISPLRGIEPGFYPLGVWDGS